ncbi:protein Fe65 homolog isoform X1 [Plodia interpunctella]|uniref:protein Fe65 homolog isoform X1 n=1 Tax=Plodia interpunctella TaxID=58824 RepID=UPI002368A10E|nr:protein Fe65 homolog isoform X1 [Plodia interpunctella]
MLCGAIWSAAPVSLRGLAPPLPAARPAILAALVMHALHDHRIDDDSSFIENGLLSYENPNYHLDPSRLESAIYSDLYDMHDDKNLPDDYDAYLDNRRVEDETTSPVKTNEKSGLITPQNGGEESPPPEKERADQEDTEKSHSGPVPHSAEGPNDDLYAIPVKLRPKKEPQLPPGWEKHEDNDGPYYWHIKSGTIQREIPKMPPVEAKESRISMVRDCSNLSDVKYEAVMTTSVTRSTTSGCLDHVDQEERKRKEDMSFKRRSFPARPEPDAARAVRFFVRSLGWVEISEADLTPERSSRAVNKCIVDLSLGRNDLLDQVGRWGDGKDLFMDLDDGALKLIDPESLTTLHTQPIHTIRVWGVGRDNGRDFAYVARDRATRKHMCHVFRCEAPARTIANALRDICKRIMIERSLQPPPRPTDLPAARRPRPLSGTFPLQGASFPTPMEEPRKTVRARYLGSAEVTRATGMDVLNDALDRLAAARAPCAWRPVAVAVAPSMITITEEGETTPIVECRVRYLSFLGIGRDVRRCAFIVHTAQDLFVAHAFHAEPSSGALCKTIEAACKLRYQKCLDAHGGAASLGSGGSAGAEAGRGSLGQALKSFVGSLTGRRAS